MELPPGWDEYDPNWDPNRKEKLQPKTVQQMLETYDEKEQLFIETAGQNGR